MSRGVPTFTILGHLLVGRDPVQCGGRRLNRGDKQQHCHHSGCDGSEDVHNPALLGIVGKNYTKPLQRGSEQPVATVESSAESLIQFKPFPTLERPHSDEIRGDGTERSSGTPFTRWGPCLVDHRLTGFRHHRSSLAGCAPTHQPKQTEALNRRCFPTDLLRRRRCSVVAGASPPPTESTR